jgi:hypothetical protein
MINHIVIPISLTQPAKEVTMMSLNWGKISKRIVLTLALALTLTSTFTLPPTAKPPTHTVEPQVNWNS